MLRTQDYINLVEKHRKEIEAFPIAYAFDEKQLKEALEKLGAKDVSECVTISGIGDIVLKKDAPRYIQTLKDQRKETLEALKDKDFAVAAFRYEMDNHEYAINYDGDGDVLGCFGMEMEDLINMGLEDVYLIARKGHMEYMHKLGVI